MLFFTFNIVGEDKGSKKSDFRTTQYHFSVIG